MTVRQLIFPLLLAFGAYFLLNGMAFTIVTALLVGAFALPDVWADRIIWLIGDLNVLQLHWRVFSGLVFLAATGLAVIAWRKYNA